MSEDEPQTYSKYAPSAAGRPTGTTVTSSYFFSTPELSQRLDLLHHLVENSDLVPVVKGPTGAGKTTFLYQFQSLAADNWLFCRIDANPMMHPDQLLSRLASSFGVIEEDDRLLEHIAKRLEILRAEGLLPLIVVDDADQLPAATLMTLLRLHEMRPNDELLAGLLLFANANLDQLLAMPQLQAMNLQHIHSLELPLLSEEQIPEYVRYQLASEGFKGELVLDPTQIKKLHRDSGGLPSAVNRRIVALVKTSLSSRPPRTSSKSRLTVPPLAWAGGIASLVILLLALVLQDQINSLFAPSQLQREIALPTTLEKTSVADEEKTSARTQDTFPGTLANERQLEIPSDSITAPVEKQLEAPSEPISAVLAEQPGADSESPEPRVVADSLGIAPPMFPPVATQPQLARDNMPAAEPAVNVSEKAEDIFETDTAQSNTEIISKSPQLTHIPEATAPSEDSTVPVVAPPKKKQGPSSLVKRPAAVAETPRKFSKPKTAAPVEDRTAQPKPIPAAPAPSVTSELQWLRKQKPSHYTLQLLGLRDQTALIKFIQRHRLQGVAHPIRIIHRGEPWHVLLFGTYPTREKALAARKTLPQAIDGDKAWPRTIASVIAALPKPKR